MDKKKLLNVAAAGLFLVALILWFVVPVVAQASPEITYTFLDLTFGKTETVLGVEFVVFKFSFLNFLVPILLVVGIALGVSRVVVKKLEKNKMLGFVLLTLGLVAVVLVFLTKSIAVMNENVDKAEFFKDFKFTGGAVVTLLLAALGGVAGVGADLLK